MTEAPGPSRRWVLAARPRTLPAAGVPVVVGTFLIRPLSIEWLNSLLCLVIALSLQIATNYANDYSDGVRGTDELRVGPFRLDGVTTGARASRATRAYLGFALACVAGLWLASRTSWWFVAIGATAVLAGWFYTGGPRPYGYYGFGELFVFVYFGLVATVGTTYAQHLTIPSRAWWLGVASGFMACALLEANNLRDVEGDRAAGKKTLAARLGRQRSSWLYVVCVAGCGARGAYWPRNSPSPSSPWSCTFRHCSSPSRRDRGRELLPMLKYSARAQLQIGALLAVLLVTNAYWG